MALRSVLAKIVSLQFEIVLRFDKHVVSTFIRAARRPILGALRS